MDFHVACVCGRSLTVSEGAAGAVFPCDCGRKVTVPSLGELRQRAGLPAVPLTTPQLIGQMLKHGELPPAEGCVRCGAVAGEVVETVAECERVWARETGGVPWIFLLYDVFLILLVLIQRQEIREYGSVLNVRVPIRVCRRCQRGRVRAWLLPALHYLKFAAAAAGVAVWLFWSDGGLWLVAAAVVLGLLEAVGRRWRQAAVKKMLRQVPIYKQLLDEYPHAEVVWDQG